MLRKQVVAPKGLDISRPTTVVGPNHVGFAELFSQGTKSVAKALCIKINKVAQVKIIPEESVMGQNLLTDRWGNCRVATVFTLASSLRPGPRV